MTIGEKRKVIEEHCERRVDCSGCVLNGKFKSCYNMCLSNDEVNEAYNIIYAANEVNHPTHYTSGKHECIDVMVAMFGVEAVKDFCKCNIFKYRFRAGLKPGESAEKDISKAEWYEDKLIELERG